MQSGWLRHRVTIEEKLPSQNGFGEEIVTWGEVATVWASVEPLRGREYRAADSEQAEMTTRIRARWRDGVIPTMRASWNGHVFDIEQVIRPLERKREMILMCRENVADGS